MSEPKYVTCRCRHCNGRIEFDASSFTMGETRTADCPYCKLETILFVPSVQQNQLFESPPSSPINNLRACPDCKKDISIHAESCPHCGAPIIRKIAGIGCPKCGSQNVYQQSHSSGAGIGLFFAGLVLAFFTWGFGLLLWIIAFFLNEKRGHCRDCKWVWKV